MCLRFRGHPVDCKVRCGVAPRHAGEVQEIQTLRPQRPQRESRASPRGSCSWFLMDFTHYTDALVTAPPTPANSCRLPECDIKVICRQWMLFLAR